MIKSETIFNEEQLKRIMSYTETYLELYANPEDEIIDRSKNRIGWEENGWAKYFKCINLPRDEETVWLFQTLLSWFTSKTGIRTVDMYSAPFASKNREVLLTIQGYDSGDRFDRHIDIQPGFASNRLYNVGVQLNDDYEGGEFIIWNEKDEELTIPKVAGTAVTYDIRFWHQISPIKSGTRWSIVFPILKEFVLDKRLM